MGEGSKGLEGRRRQRAGMRCEVSSIDGRRVFLSTEIERDEVWAALEEEAGLPVDIWRVSPRNVF